MNSCYYYLRRISSGIGELLGRTNRARTASMARAAVLGNQSLLKIFSEGNSRITQEYAFLSLTQGPQTEIFSDFSYRFLSDEISQGILK